MVDLDNNWDIPCLQDHYWICHTVKMTVLNQEEIKGADPISKVGFTMQIL